MIAMALSNTTTLAECFLEAPPYQGCANSYAGTPHQLGASLNELERTGRYIAEPKLDGIWVAAIGSGQDAPPVLITRGGKRDKMRLPVLPTGTMLIGELCAGRLHLFDVLWVNERYVGELPYAKRRAVLVGMNLDTAFYPVVPKWSADFLGHFAREQEGIVLKAYPGGAYSGGNCREWTKFKKRDTHDVIVWGCHADGKSLSVAQYREGLSGDAPVAQATGLPLTIVRGEYQYGLCDCGKVILSSPEWQGEIAQNGAAWIGKVIEITAYKRFDSGAFRHAFPASLTPEAREDKPASACLIADSIG